MANPLASAGARALHSPSFPCTSQALSWIKRRARRVERFYQVSRREALACASMDFSSFNPTAK
ncbi:MAG: hypothetical protein HHJ17_02805 [Rhodoferax sp.]|uniref:hypothetical protein n=1 Tax=Rhodoferax sp. TaxID=50421 RepID=UPI0017CE4CE1|nr:hypothetical protein [Rhodoferax sp.]NMM12460.1 hypothetical protein [Rhodoferax sp.]NMM21650.1 hypothetical protein [Rhodoferax sp.]